MLDKCDNEQDTSEEQDRRPYDSEQPNRRLLDRKDTTLSNFTLPAKARAMLGIMRAIRPGSGGGNMFQDIDRLRDPPKRLSSTLSRKSHVFNESCCGMLAKSKRFEAVTMFVILLNAIELGWDADYVAGHGSPENLYKGPMGFIIAEVGFAVYFTIEVIIRFLAFRQKHHCCCDAWFVFDFSLVALMDIETFILPFAGGSNALAQFSILRLLRILRITRMVRLMRFIPQLLIICKAIGAALRAVSWTAVLLVLMIYAWAILFTNEYHEGKDADSDARAVELFGTMGKSMLNLLIMGSILDDITFCTDGIRQSNQMIMLVLFLIFVVIASFMMMNMLVGILAEVVGASAEGEAAKLQNAQIAEAISDIVETLDVDDSGSISREEYNKMCKDPSVTEALGALEINDSHFSDYAQLLFEDTENGDEEEKVYSEDVINMIQKLRPGNTVHKLDFTQAEAMIRRNLNSTRQRIEDVERLCQEVTGIELSPFSSPKLSPNASFVFGRPRTPSYAGAPHVDTDPLPPLRLAATASSEASLSPTPPPCLLRGVKVSPPSVSPVHMPPHQGVLRLSTLAKLKNTSSAEIIRELSNRLGVANLSESTADMSNMSQEMQILAEAFGTLNVPPETPEVQQRNKPRTWLA